MNLLSNLFEQVQNSEEFKSFPSVSETDSLFFDEFSEILESYASNPFDFYKELTYLYVRYTGTTDQYKQIPPFIEKTPNSQVIYLILYFRSFAAHNIFDFYDLITAQSEEYLNAHLKHRPPQIGTILSMLKNYSFKQDPEEKLSNLDSSLCEFCEYISYLRTILDLNKFENYDLEFLIVISIYFGYINREDREKWELCTSSVLKVINSYTNDSLRSDGFLNLNGVALFEIFRNNNLLLRTSLRDVNLWVLAGYRFRLDNMMREWDDIKEAIDREEFSISNLQRTRDVIRETKAIHSSFLFCNWNVSHIHVRQAEKIIVLFTWAEYKIKKLQD